MVNFRLLFRILGHLLYLLVLFMLLCLGVAFYYGEDDVVPFIIAILLTLSGAFISAYLGRNANNTMSRRDTFLVVTMTWMVFSVFGMLPYLAGGYITNITDGFFETMSGFTTTGATVLDDVECLPHGILFWRSLSQWIGGLGIVFFTIAILPSMVGGSTKVFAAEATGPMKSKMHPRLTTTAKWIWSVYLSLTIACAVSFWGLGMTWFEAINYSMTTTATGGFSIYNDMSTYFGSAAIEYVAIVFQFLSGINFTLLYIGVFKGRVGQLFTNSEFRLYTNLIIVATAIIAATLVLQNNYEYERAFRSALFNVVSFVTSTGITNDDAILWPHHTWIIIGILMFVGGCAGSTSGGFKVVRLEMLFKMLRNEFKHILHPNAVIPVKINNTPVNASRLQTLSSFFVVCVLLIIISTVMMIAQGIDNTNAMTISIGCISNAGPSLANTLGPAMSWNDLADYSKWFCSILMLMGRLEVMTVLVLFTRSYWTES